MHKHSEHPLIPNTGIEEIRCEANHAADVKNTDLLIDKNCRKSNANTYNAVYNLKVATKKMNKRFCKTCQFNSQIAELKPIIHL